jgi:TonB family protein
MPKNDIDIYFLRSSRNNLEEKPKEGKMKYVSLLLLVLLFSGCAVFHTENSMTEPMLLKQSPLPDIPLSLADKNLEIIGEFLISKEGVVKRVKLVNSSGDAAWDKLAESSFMKWQFSPAQLNGEPAEVLIRRKVRLIYLQPEIVRLAEITVKDSKEAETVYNALRKGADFDELVKEYSVSPSKEHNGVVGKVDLRYYAKSLREPLSKLKLDEYTRPLPYGDHYVIYKRIKENYVLEY